MKKRILIALVVVLALAATASVVWAHGGPHGRKYVRFSGHESFWVKTGSGLAHQWRDDFHCVYKPKEKFEVADCDVDDPDFLSQDDYLFDESAITEEGGDDADVGDFLEHDTDYWQCFYAWTDE